jgi:molybdopterin converting factor small subunit
MSIKVRVKVFGALRKQAGGEELEIELEQGARVIEAIQAAGLEDRVDLWVLLDGDRAGREARLHDGAELTFFQPVGGG